jgi:hypothetical protein
MTTPPLQFRIKRTDTQASYDRPSGKPHDLKGIGRDDGSWNIDPEEGPFMINYQFYEY